MVATEKRPIAILSPRVQLTDRFLAGFEPKFRPLFLHVSSYHRIPIKCEYSDVFRLVMTEDDPHRYQATRNAIIDKHIPDGLVPKYPYAIISPIWQSYEDLRAYIHPDDWHKFRISNVFKPLRTYKRYHQIFYQSATRSVIYSEREQALLASQMDETLVPGVLTEMPEGYTQFGRARVYNGGDPNLYHETKGMFIRGPNDGRTKTSTEYTRMYSQQKRDAKLKKEQDNE